MSVQWYLSSYNTWSVTNLLVVSATLTVIVIWWFNGMPTYVPGWIGWVTIAVQSLIAGRILTYGAIQRIGSEQFALLSPLETAMAVIWSVLFLGEWLSITKWSGTVLILISDLLADKIGRRTFAC